MVLGVFSLPSKKVSQSNRAECKQNPAHSSMNISSVLPDTTYILNLSKISLLGCK